MPHWPRPAHMTPIEDFSDAEIIEAGKRRWQPVRDGQCSHAYRPEGMTNAELALEIIRRFEARDKATTPRKAR